VESVPTFFAGICPGRRRRFSCVKKNGRRLVPALSLLLFFGVVLSDTQASFFSDAKGKATDAKKKKYRKNRLFFEKNGFLPVFLLAFFRK